VEGAVQVERLGDLDRVREAALLQLHAESLTHLRPVLDRVESQHGDRARVGCSQAGDALDRCRLPGAVGPDDAEDLSLVDGEGDVVDGDVPPVTLVQVPYL